MSFRVKRDKCEDELPTSQRKKLRLDDDPLDDMSGQNLGSPNRCDSEPCGVLMPITANNMIDADSRSQEPVHSTDEDADPEAKQVIRRITNLEHLLNGCYQVQSRVLLYLNRIDFRSMQLAGLGLNISRIIQRKHLIPTSCSNHEAIRPRDNRRIIRLRFLTHIGWVSPTGCNNTTATMDEIKACTGLIWPNKNPSTILDVDLSRIIEDIDECRCAHFNFTNSEARGSSHQVCLECIQCAERQMSPLEKYKIKRLQRTLCSKHTKENTPLAQHGPCKCLLALNTEWRCWGCRRSTRRGLISIGLRRRKLLDKGPNGDHDENAGKDEDGTEKIEGDEGGDEGSDGSDDFGEDSDGNDSDDRDIKDEKIPSDKAHFCPIANCQEWITSRQQRALKREGKGLRMCLACKTILLPSVTVEKEG